MKNKTPRVGTYTLREATKRAILDRLDAAGPKRVYDLWRETFPERACDGVIREALKELVATGEVVRLPDPAAKAPGASVYAAADRPGGATDESRIRHRRES